MSPTRLVAVASAVWCLAAAGGSAGLGQPPPEIGERPTVRVVLAGSGQGRVTSRPPGLDCKARCTARVPLGSTVILTATPAVRSQFAGWTGACAGRAVWCVFEARDDVVTRARFARAAGGGSVEEVADSFVTRPVLNVTVSDARGGTVTSVGGDISCSDRCWARFDTSMRVVLRATARRGYRFTKWSSLLAPCSTGKTCVVSMNTTTDVTATFVATRR